MYPPTAASDMPVAELRVYLINPPPWAIPVQGLFINFGAGPTPRAVSERARRSRCGQCLVARRNSRSPTARSRAKSQRAALARMVGGTQADTRAAKSSRRVLAVSAPLAIVYPPSLLLVNPIHPDPYKVGTTTRRRAHHGKDSTFNNLGGRRMPRFAQTRLDHAPPSKPTARRLCSLVRHDRALRAAPRSMPARTMSDHDRSLRLAARAHRGCARCVPHSRRCVHTIPS